MSGQQHVDPNHGMCGLNLTHQMDCLTYPSIQGFGLSRCLKGPLVKRVDPLKVPNMQHSQTVE